MYICIIEAVIIHPENKEQLAAIKAFTKALHMKFETGEEGTIVFFEELKEAVNDVFLIKAGKKEGRPLEDLLNEL